MAEFLAALSVLAALTVLADAHEPAFGSQDQAIEAERSRLVDRMAKCTVPELTALTQDDDASLAMAASWRIALSESLAANEGNAGSMGEAQVETLFERFERITSFPMPELREIVEKSRVFDGETVFFRIDDRPLYDLNASPFQPARGIACSRAPNGDLAVSVGERNVRLPSSFVDRWLESGYSRLAGAAFDRSVYLLAHDRRGRGGVLCRLDDDSTILWSRPVWTCNRLAGRGIPRHVCLVTASKEGVCVIGADSHSIFVETFSPDGAAEAKLNSAMWYLDDR